MKRLLSSISNNAEPRYYTNEFDEVKFRRDAVRATSSDSVNNHIHLSDDPDDSSSSTNTPTAILPLSHSQQSQSSAANDQHFHPDRAVPFDAPSSHDRPDIDMQDAFDNPFFEQHGQDFMNSDPPAQEVLIPDNPLAKQSKLVSKMDALPSTLATPSAAIFWDAVLDHF